MARALLLWVMVGMGEHPPHPLAKGCALCTPARRQRPEPPYQRLMARSFVTRSAVEGWVLNSPAKLRPPIGLTM